MSCNYNNHIGMAFAMTNERNNSIVAFIRDITGTLSYPKVYQTGGNGTGVQKVDPLGSQGSIALSRDGRFLFVVNAGSNSISSFFVCKKDLTLVDIVPSGGIFPNSLTIIDNLLYVTNSGDSTHDANVTGFHIANDGHLSIINRSQKPLSASNVQPGCIVSSPRAYKLVVSEKLTNNLSVFDVKSNGELTDPIVNASNGTVPFGSAYLHKDLLLVSEAGPNALSSYTVTKSGILNVISSSILNSQAATCWVSVDPNNRYAYTSNAGSSTITFYHINQGGTLTVVESIPSTPNRTGNPIDNAIDNRGQNLYVLNGGEGSISVFKIEKNGHLVLLQIYQDTKLPQIGAQGLAIL